MYTSKSMYLFKLISVPLNEYSYILLPIAIANLLELNLYDLKWQD